MITVDNWILVHADTGVPVKQNEKVEDCHITGGRPPHKPSSTGRVWVEEYSQEYFPTVFKLKWKVKALDA